MPERTTKTFLRLIAVMMTDPSKDWYGLELMESARLSSGTLYPLLQRLVRDDWLERTGEAPSERGGTSRRIYRMTGHGVRSADALLAARATLQRKTAPRPRLGTLPV